MTPSASSTIRSPIRPPKGYTLVELLVTIGVIGVLVGLLFPAIQSVRESARKTTCANNMRNIALAILNFEAAHQQFPVGIHAVDHPKTPSMSWLTQALPFIEQEQLWQTSVNEYRQGISPFSPHTGLRTVVEFFECPSYPHAGMAHFTHDNRVVASTCYVGVKCAIPACG